MTFKLKQTSSWSNLGGENRQLFMENFLEWKTDNVSKRIRKTKKNKCILRASIFDVFSRKAKKIKSRFSLILSQIEKFSFAIIQYKRVNMCYISFFIIFFIVQWKENFGSVLGLPAHIHVIKSDKEVCSDNIGQKSTLEIDVELHMRFDRKKIKIP